MLDQVVYNLLLACSDHHVHYHDDYFLVELPVFRVLRAYIPCEELDKISQNYTWVFRQRAPAVSQNLTNIAQNV